METIYVSSQSSRAFRIKHQFIQWNKGYFVCTRFVTGIRTQNGKWYQKLPIVLFITALFPFSIIFDIVALLPLFIVSDLQNDRLEIRHHSTQWNKGIFFFVRYVWNFVSGKGTAMKMFIFHFITIVVFTPIALIFDLMYLIVVKGGGFVLYKSGLLIFKILEALFVALITVIGKVLTWGLILITVIVIVIVFYNNWETITGLINNLVNMVI